MRFWQKIFLYALALLMVTISIVSLILLRGNHRGNIEQARQSAINTHDLVIGSMQTAIIHDRYQAGNVFLFEEDMLESVSRLAESYNRPAFFNDIQSGQPSIIYFQLFREGNQVFSNLPFEPSAPAGDGGRLNIYLKNQSDSKPLDRPELAIQDPLERFTIVRSLDQGHWLFVSSLVELENRTYTLVTINNVSAIYEQLEHQINLFADLMLALALSAAGVLLLIVVILTRPIAVLRQYTSRFSKGEYNIRLAVGGRDELSALGHDFNTMAEAVEKNIMSLELMNEERTRFIDNLTHEIKSPLTSIIGFADLLRQTPQLSQEERMRQADYIYREGRHLEHIAKLLMDLTLLRRDDHFEMETVDLYDLLEETYILSRPIMEKYKIVLNLNNVHGQISVNLELFRSLLSNLLENAAKASTPGEIVTLSASINDDGGMSIIISDQGCGIPADELDKIRQPFYVLDKARTRKAGGAGLGLALCDEIIRLHKARLMIESNVGRGTDVIISFPPADHAGDNFDIGDSAGGSDTANPDIADAEADEAIKAGEETTDAGSTN